MIYRRPPGVWDLFLWVMLAITPSELLAEAAEARKAWRHNYKRMWQSLAFAAFFSGMLAGLWLGRFLP